MPIDPKFTEALLLARQAYIAEVEQGEAIAKSAFEAATTSYSDQALATCTLAQLKFNLRNSFFTLALDEYNETVLEFNAHDFTDPKPIYQALAKCSAALEVSFPDISEFEAALEIFRTSGPAGEHMYPDLMEGLLDLAENREIIASEIAENITWLFNEIERRKPSQ